MKAVQHGVVVSLRSKSSLLIVIGGQCVARLAPVRVVVLKSEHLSCVVTDLPLMKRLNAFILAGSHLGRPGLSPQKVHVGRRRLLPESTLESCESSYHIGPPLQEKHKTKTTT